MVRIGVTLLCSYALDMKNEGSRGPHGCYTWMNIYGFQPRADKAKRKGLGDQDQETDRYKTGEQYSFIQRERERELPEWLPEWLMQI